MTLETLYYLSQIIAVVAILFSILFVAFQIRQNTKALRATSHHAITDSFNTFNAILGTDVKAARIWRLGHLGFEHLDEDEQVSFSYLCIGYMRIFETLYFQAQNGTMDQNLFDTENRSLEWAFSNPGMRQWWDINPISFSDEYRRYIDALIVSAAKMQGDALAPAQD